MSFLDKLDAFAKENERLEVEELRSRTQEESIAVMDMLCRTAFPDYPDPKWAYNWPIALSKLIREPGE